MNNNASAPRLFSIDLLKAMSIAAVVSYHSIFVPESTYESVLPLLDTLFTPLRFCVPVFFTISFFLLERGLINNLNQSNWFLLKKRITRLVIPILFWFSLGVILRIISGINSQEKLLTSIFQGLLFPGAYYLLILLQLLPIFILLHNLFIRPKNVSIAILFQGVVFLLVDMSLMGILGTEVPLILRIINRPFVAYWFVYMALGAYFYNNWSMLIEMSNRISVQIKICLLSLGYLVMIVEFSCLHSLAGTQLHYFEYVMFSCPLIVLFMFLCFASVRENQVPLYIQNIIRILSKYSLGIFCINGIISSILYELSRHLFVGVTFNILEILVMKFIGWGLLLALSLGLSILLKRLGLGSCVC